jgi:hypothetical protein
MSYIDYLKAKEQEKKRNDIRPHIPDIVGYGRVKCDLCGRFSDVTDPNSELSTVTNASDGTKRFYHFCYKCLHKRMDVDDIHGFYTDEEVKRWRLKYKEAKTKKAANSYDDLCLNCFIKSNGIRVFTESEVENEEWQEYVRTHNLYVLLQTGVDKYTNQDGSETTECHTSFTLTETNFRNPSTNLNICEGKNKSLCEKCRFRKKEEQ